MNGVACVTVLPLLLIGIFARVVLKMNFMDLSGLLAGSDARPSPTRPSIRSPRCYAFSPHKSSPSSSSDENHYHHPTGRSPAPIARFILGR